MSKIDQLVKTIVKAIDEKDRKKTQALDTVATVSRIDGDTAWVNFAGSDSETPVKQTIAVKKGDKVQVRASKGSAWITGNITSPPTDNTLAEEAVKKSDTATKRAKRAEDMSIVADVMYYLASDQDEGVTTEDEGWTQEPQEATVALPYLWCYHEYTRGNGTKFNSDPVIIAYYAEDGVGVVSVETYYYVSTSQYQTIGGSWGTTYNYVSGTYIWRKELITHDDGTTTWTTALYDGGLTQTCELAYDAAQYIWTQPAASATTNVPSGQYVTEVDKDSYRTSPTGGALLLRSTGLFLRYAAKTLVELVSAGLKIYEPSDTTYPSAQFLSSGAVIGKENGGNIQTTSSSIDFRNGTTTLADMTFSTSAYTGSGVTISSPSNGSFGNGELTIWARKAASGGIKAMAAAILTAGSYIFQLQESRDTTEKSGAYCNCDMEVAGTLTAGAINNSLFDVSSVSVSTDSGTGNRTGTATATKSGYYPLAIAGLSVATGGCYSRGVYLTAQSSGSCTVNFRAYNDSGTSQAVNATAYVLWVKTTA